MTQLEQIQKQLDKIERIALFRAKDVFNIDEVCWYTGFKECTIRTYVRERKIPYYKLDNGSLRFKRDEIGKWLCNNRIATQEEIEERADRILRKMRS